MRAEFNRLNVEAYKQMCTSDQNLRPLISSNKLFEDNILPYEIRFNAVLTDHPLKTLNRSWDYTLYYYYQTAFPRVGKYDLPCNEGYYIVS